MSAYSPDPGSAPRPASPPDTAAAYVALGSNLGDRHSHVRRAMVLIADLPGVIRLTPSALYETDPVGPQDQDAFINAVARVDTSLTAETLLDNLLAIELRLGRAPREQRRHWGPRVIDLDLILFGDAVIDQPGLQVPHPRMHERWFVLKPLCDVGPGVVHPTRGQTMAELLAHLEPAGSVHE